MKDEKANFEFDSVLSEAGPKTFMSTIIVVPPKIMKSLPKKGRIRINGVLNGISPFNLAIQSQKNGEKFISINTALRKSSKIKLGDSVHISFILADPMFIEFPDELLIAMEQDPEAKNIFESFSNGYQRGIVHYINSGKSIDTRIKRSLQMLEKAKRGEFQMQQKKM